MARVCLNIDAGPERKGQLLSITDPTTDLTIEHTTRFVSQNDIANFASIMKIEYQNPDLKSISPAKFGTILEDVSKITVYENLPNTRYPSGCSYDFECSRKPRKDCGLPTNFDYGSVHYMVQTALPVSVSKQSIAAALAAVQHESRGLGAGHPGITSDRAFLDQLDLASCADIEDDVIKTPYYDDWKVRGRIDTDHWCPVLREDGFVGIFRDDSSAAAALEDLSGVVKYYIVAHNALAYFACDQLRVLVETNVKDWTWQEWKNSAEVRRATEFSTIIAKTVCDRVLVALEALETVGLQKPLSYKSSAASEKSTGSSTNRAFPLKQTKPPLITTYNVLNPDPLKFQPHTISYDSGVVRSSHWSKDGTLTQMKATASHACNERFVWMKNVKCENGHWSTKIDRCKNDVVIAAIADDAAVDEICNRLNKMPEFTLQRVDLVSIGSY